MDFLRGQRGEAMNHGAPLRKTILILLPSLRISGGIKEAIRLAEDLRERGQSAELVVLWKSKYELPCGQIPIHHLSRFATNRALAAVQFPLLLIRFLLFLRRQSASADRGRAALILTHFSTFPFAWMVPRFDWYCFNQGVEWMFVSKGWRRWFLKRFILATCRRSSCLTTNEYLEWEFEQEGIRHMGRLSIWPDMDWLTDVADSAREIDVVMLLRSGQLKRLDLYLQMLGLLQRAGLSSFVITPDVDIFEIAAPLSGTSLLRPSRDEFRAVYRRSKVFLLLSDTEGFSLPPLEAMGSGCIPVSRDCGGPRCYMTGPLRDNLIPLDATCQSILDHLQLLLSDRVKLSTLSELARLEFSRGALSSAQRRDECLAALSASLAS